MDGKTEERALPCGTGPSQAEPEVSALRASVPSAIRGGRFVAKPPTLGADPKMALEGTIMLRRSEVAGALGKAVHYARRNIDLAEAQGRLDDAEQQRIRLRAFYTLREYIFTLPQFENPAPAFALPRDSDGSPKGGDACGSVEDDSAAIAQGPTS